MSNKKGIGIVIGIVIALVLVIMLFTNVGQLFYNASNDVISQVEISNPLQTYRIDSRCDLSYFILDKTVTHRKIPPEIIAENIPDNLNEKLKEIAEKYPERYDDPDELNKMQLDIFETILLKPFMQQNSVHPKLEPVVRKWLAATSPFGPDFQQGSNMRFSTLNVILLTDKDYAEDPECAQKHKKYFSDTMEKIRKEWE